MLDSAVVFDAVAVSGTDVYKSKVATQEKNRLFYQFSNTGASVTGVLKGQVNNLPEVEYRKAVAAASGSTFEEKEAANDVGWVDQDFRNSDANAHLAAATHAVSGPGSLTLNFPKGPKRHRLVYTNATNSGVITAYRRYI